ncbi:MAG TPA: hypothetical protein VMA09_23915 [Candidatus Binataceae bacterium]|nr:hypothetical protein [Candidatus Binataceae bacterium]
MTRNLVEAMRTPAKIERQSTAIDRPALLTRAIGSLPIKKPAAQILKRMRSGVGALETLSTIESHAGVGSVAAISGIRPPQSKLAQAGRERFLPLQRLVGLERRHTQTRGPQGNKYYFPARVSGDDRTGVIAPQPRLESPSFSDLTARRSAASDGPFATSSLTLHSAPTVVVRDSNDMEDIEQRISSALRRHRAELFDQIKREAARRERLRF